jgi:hypothetical protein
MNLPDQIQFQGSAESKGFNPITPASPTRALEADAARLSQSWEQAAGKTLAQEQRLINFNDQQIKYNVEALSGFSQTLSKRLTEWQDAKNESLMEAGLMEAYADGLPKETEDKFNAEEAALTQADTQTRIISADYQAQGGDQFVAEKFRNLSGWKKYGYARGLAELAGVNYPTFYAQQAASASVVINDQKVTLATATDPAERAAIEAQIRGKYLRQFGGLNPALLNKYMFPQMKAHEAKAAIEWSEQRSAILKEERKAEAQDALWAGIQSGRGGDAFVQFTQQFQGDFGGLGNTRKMGAELLTQMIKDRKIGQPEVDAILNHKFVAKDGNLVTLGEYWGRDFAGVKDALYTASRTDLQQQLQRQEDQASEFKLEFDRATAERRAQGKDWSEAELKALSDDYASKGLGEAPDWLKNAMTKEDRSNRDDKERLLALRQSRGYLTEEDLRNITPTLYSEMVGYVKADKPLAEAPESLTTEANTKIATLAGERLNETDGTKEKSSAYQNARYNAQRAYSKYFAEAVREGRTQQEAHEKAMQRIEANFKVGTYTVKPTATADQTRQLNYAQASKAWSKNPSLVNTAVLPGTEQDLVLLEQYAKTGRGEIPYIYNQLAQGHRNLTAWDIAEAQLQAAGKGSLLRPQAQQYVDRQDPQIKRLLQWRPTAARSNRVAIGTGWKPMLDLIASKESLSYGEYDAMNSGGSNNGTVAFGSANSMDVFGRGLSTMTIGEVMNLQAQGKLHAAGRYQIIGKTLKDVMRTSPQGLTANSPFNAATQDSLAIALARRRIAAGNSLTGLRNEWVGLQKVSDTTLQNAINNINVQSPYNEPENLLPRLVYRIGNRGYGSTGPHLDVKPVSPGTLQANQSLPAISMKELDPYMLVGKGKKALSQGTTTTDNDSRHRSRGSFGHDFAAPDGTPVYLTNGARVVGSFKGDGGTDHTIIELPDGRRYQLLHGVNA